MANFEDFYIGCEVEVTKKVNPVWAGFGKIIEMYNDDGTIIVSFDRNIIVSFDRNIYTQGGFHCSELELVIKIEYEDIEI